MADDHAPPPGPEPARPDRSRTDALARGMGFRSWLYREHADPADPLFELRQTMGPKKAPFGLVFNAKRWIETLQEVAPDRPELVDDLLKAEAEWRAEVASYKSGTAALGLVPTFGKINQLDWRIPQPDVTCGFLNRAGVACRDEVVPGSNRCVRHGGSLVEPEVRRAMLISAYCAVVEGAEKAVEALLYVAEHGRNELARVQAAKELLDRAGLTPQLQVSITMEGEQRGAAMANLRAKLDSMQRGLDATVIETHVVEAGTNGNGNGSGSSGDEV